MLNFQLLFGDLTSNALFSEFITFSFCSPTFFKQPKWVHSHVFASLPSLVPSLPYSHCDGGDSVSPFSLPTWVQALICVSFVPSLTGGPSLSGFLINFPCFPGLIPHSFLFPFFSEPSFCYFSCFSQSSNIFQHEYTWKVHKSRHFY